MGCGVGAVGVCAGPARAPGGNAGPADQDFATAQARTALRARARCVRLLVRDHVITMRDVRRHTRHSTMQSLARRK